MSASLHHSVCIYVCVVFTAARVFVWADEPSIVASCAVIAAFVGGGVTFKEGRLFPGAAEQKQHHAPHLVPLTFPH